MKALFNIFDLNGHTQEFQQDTETAYTHFVCHSKLNLGAKKVQYTSTSKQM